MRRSSEYAHASSLTEYVFSKRQIVRPFLILYYGYVGCVTHHSPYSSSYIASLSSCYPANSHGTPKTLDISVSYSVVEAVNEVVGIPYQRLVFNHSIYTALCPPVSGITRTIRSHRPSIMHFVS